MRNLGTSQPKEARNEFFLKETYQEHSSRISHAVASGGAGQAVERMGFTWEWWREGKELTAYVEEKQKVFFAAEIWLR